jgi:transposase
MSIYAGLDVSDKTTHICVVDAEGKVSRRDVVASDPDVLAKWLNRHCAGVVTASSRVARAIQHG